MAPKADPRLKRTQPAPVPSNFLGGARKKEVVPKAEALDTKMGKRQLSQSAEKMASVSKKTKEAGYDPKSEAVPLSSAFRNVRDSSPAASSVTTQEVQEMESDTDVEAVPETRAVGEATSQMENLGQAKVG
jgi:hypothetical protein